jgi:hypothetical protein
MVAQPCERGIAQPSHVLAAPTHETRGNRALTGHDQDTLVVGTGQPRFHASDEWMADDRVDRHDPVSFATGWVKSVAYVSALSLWALVSGHWAAWQAARVEVAQKQDEDRHAAEDVPEDVVDHLVAETNLSREPAPG